MSKKDAFYFKHDSNSRNDEKLLSVRMKYGMEGYGIYWAILEKLRDDPEFMMKTDYSLIAWDLRVEASMVQSVVEDFSLFHFTDDGRFYSERMLRDMSTWKEIKRVRSEAGRKSAEARQNSKGGTNVEQMLNTCLTNAEQKGVEEPAKPTPPASEEPKQKTIRFVPPTLDEVKAYAAERGGKVDPVRWFNFYQSKGWMIGKNKMKDWHAAFRTWERDNTNTYENGRKQEERNVIAGADAFGASD